MGIWPDGCGITDVDRFMGGHGEAVVEFASEAGELVGIDYPPEEMMLAAADFLDAA
jgi:hypothetical protein